MQLQHIKLLFHSVGVAPIQLLLLLPAGRTDLRLDLQVFTTGREGKAELHKEMSDEVKEDYIVITVKVGFHTIISLGVHG